MIVGVGVNGAHLMDEVRGTKVEPLYDSRCRDICHLYNATLDVASPDNVMETLLISFDWPMLKSLQKYLNIIYHKCN